VLDLLSVSVPPAAHAVAFAGSWLWADEARQAGVVCGLEQWTDRLRRRRHGWEQRLADLAAGDESFGDEDEEPGGRRRRLEQRLAAAAGLEAAAAALAAAFAKAPACARWSVWADWLGAGLQQTFAPEVTAGAVDAVQRLRSLEATGEEVSAAEMAAALRRLLADASLLEGRIGRDGVAVFTPLALRGLRFHTVVFAGLAEGGFPARGRPDPILGDGDRQRLAESLGVRLPLAEERETESALLLASAAESAAARLVLLSPRMDAAGGRSRLPSRLLLRLASAVAGRAVGLDEFLGGAPLKSVWRRVSGDLEAASSPVVWTDEDEYDVAALLTLEASRSEAAGRYLADVLADESGDRRLAAWRAWQEVSAGAWDGLLGREAVRLLDTKGLLTSELHATRLEAYISCPFTFLLRDVLGLAAPEDPDEGLEIDPLAFGSLAHEILESAFSAVIARELDVEGALVEVRKAHERCCDVAEARGVTGDDLAWSVRRETLLEDLLEAVRRDPVFTDGRPRLVECRFGEWYERPVALELAGGRSVRFAGRIDRVDRTSRGARVVDYKTGRGRTEADRIKSGLGVQLPVYRLAVEQADDLLGEEPLDVECVYQMVTRRGSFETLSLPESAADPAALATLIARIVELVEGGVFARSTKGRCDYCEVCYACGASSWTRARKQRAQRLAPLVALQHGDLEQPSASSEAGES
jgi:RecB family exonuclease